MGTVTDIDGNVYQTVVIGDQEWMAENLKVKHYRDGSPIPNVKDGDKWSKLLTGALCAYGNNYSNVPIYGYLYNGYAVETGKLAPEGWRVPTNDDWKTLVSHLDRKEVAGGKLKEAGTSHWRCPNIEATNESGFSALPSGYRSNHSGSFYNLGNGANFWSSSETSNNNAWHWYLYCNNAHVYRHYNDKRYGFSVRCVKDIAS